MSSMWMPVLELARWAPSSHNTQPWHVTATETQLVLRVNEARHLHHTDPARRDLQLSMGGMLEACRIAAAAQGRLLQPQEPPPGALACLTYSGDAAASDGAAAAALLRQRQTSRLPFRRTAIEPAALQALHATAATHGLELHWVEHGSRPHRDLTQLYEAATREFWLDDASVAELYTWLRWDLEGIRQAPDGLSSHCLDLRLPDMLALRALVSTRLRRGLRAVFATSVAASAAAQAEVRRWQQSSGVLLVVGGGPASLAQGAGLLRLWLTATAERLAVHPVSVLLDRRGWDVARQLGANADHLLAAWRLGYSAPPPRSGRLPVAQFTRS